MRIAICDDMDAELRRIAEVTNEYLTAHGVCAEVQTFSHPDVLLSAAGKAPFDLYILDVCMPMLSGIQVGRELCRNGCAPELIYVTTSPEYAVDAFALHAIHYLLKPFTAEMLHEALNRAFAKHDLQRERILTVQAEGSVHRILFSQLAYCESRGNYQHLHLTDGTEFCLRQTSAELFSQLSPDDAFVRCGAGYIVNLEQVRSLNEKVMELQNGARLAVPRRAYAELRARYFAFFCGGETV